MFHKKTKMTIDPVNKVVLDGWNFEAPEAAIKTIKDALLSEASKCASYVVSEMQSHVFVNWDFDSEDLSIEVSIELEEYEPLAKLCFSLSEIINEVDLEIDKEDFKEVARRLRKIADSIDPPRRRK